MDACNGKIRIRVVSVLLMAVLSLGGCTQNDGHLGPLFGSWALIGITQDGEPKPLDDETVFSFQNEIVKVVRLVNPPYSSVTKFGNFTHSGDNLTMRFEPSPTPSGTYMYMAPDWLYFPARASQLPFRVRELTGSRMVLELDVDGRALTYSFEKTW